MAPSRGVCCGFFCCLAPPGAATADSVDSRIGQGHKGAPSGKEPVDIYEDGFVNSSTTTLGPDPHHALDWQEGGPGKSLKAELHSRKYSSNAVVPFHAEDHVRRASLEQRPTAHVPLIRDLTVESFVDTTTLQQVPSGSSPNEPLTGEQLQAAGFKLWHAGNVTQLPGSNVQPLTFLVLDIMHYPQPAVPESRRSTSDALATGRGDQGREYRNRLVPIYTNSCCRAYFKISAHADYVGVVQKLLKRDPLLTFALQKAVRNLRVGDARPVSHVTPDPSGQSSALHGMRFSPCCWRHDGRILPGLMVEHKLPYDPDVIMPRLMRDYAVLSHVPAILTLIDFEGKVLYQNAASLEYMGDLLSTRYDAHVQDGLLQVLFMFDMHSLEAMLEDVLHGSEWQGVVQVPYSLQHLLGQQQDDNTVIDFTRTLAPAGGPPAQPAAASRVSGSGGWFQEDFQIGGAGRVPRKSVPTNLIAQQQLGGVLATVEEARGSGGEAGLVTDARRPSLLDMAPGMQQRKFMSLLDKQAQGQSVAKRHAGDTPQQSISGAADDGGKVGGAAAGGVAVGAAGDEDDDEDDADLELEPECYHELHAIPLLDPVLDKQVIMLVQTDVTPRVELENKLADLTDAQLSMLEQLFPRHIIEYMLARVPNRVSNNMRELANTHEQVMVLFCDVVGFTSMSKEVEASEVMHFLNELYEAFDGLVDDYDMYKLDIVGDCYIVVAGLIKEDQDGFVCVEELAPEQTTRNAHNILQFGKAMLRKARSKPVLMPHNDQPVSLRIGIHTGPVVSGLVGSKMPKYTLFGDTMNTASRMESTCRQGCIHVSETFATLLPEEKWESTGGVQVKGKGLMSTFLWVPEPGTVDDVSSEGTQRVLAKSNTMQSSNSGKSRITETARTAPKLCMETGSAWTPPPVAQLEAEHVQLLLHSIDHFSEHADLGAQLVLSWQRRLAQCKGQLKHAGDEAAKQARQKTESGHERMHLLDSENRELNLQVLAWRKKTAVLRLKMSSCEEAVRDISANRQAVREEVVQLVNENEGLKQRICSLKQDMQLMLSQLQYQQDEAKLHKEASVREHDTLDQRLQRERDSLQQQLAGSRLSLSSALRHTEEVEAQLARAEAATEQSNRHAVSLQSQLSDMRARLLAAEEAANAAETNKQLAEARLRMSEQTLASLQQLEDERKRHMQELQQRLKDVSEERVKLSSDWAHVKEDQLQARIHALQGQLENQITSRHQAELGLEQQLAAMRHKAEAEARRARIMEDQVAARQATITSLEEALRSRSTDTPSRLVVAQANAAVDRIVTELGPVSEGEEEQQDEMEMQEHVAAIGQRAVTSGRAMPAAAPAPQTKAVRAKVNRAATKAAAVPQRRSPRARAPTAGGKHKPKASSDSGSDASEGDASWQEEDHPSQARPEHIQSKATQAEPAEKHRTRGGKQSGCAADTGRHQETAPAANAALEAAATRNRNERAPVGSNATAPLGRAAQQDATAAAAAEPTSEDAVPRRRLPKPKGRAAGSKRKAAVSSDASDSDEEAPEPMVSMDATQEQPEGEEEEAGVGRGCKAQAAQRQRKRAAPQGRQRKVAATASGVEAAANALAVEPHAPAAAVAPGQTLQPTVSHQELSGDDFQAADGDTLDEPEVQRPQPKQLEVRAAPQQHSQRPQTQPQLGLGLSQAAPSASLAMPSSQYTDVHSKGGSFLDRGMVTLFKSKVADHPLATLNPNVLNVAAAKRGRVSTGAKQALKRLSIGGSMGAGNLLLSGIKRKQPQALRAPVGGAAREAADVLPMDMILDSLKVPKLRHTQG